MNPVIAVSLALSLGAVALSAVAQQRLARLKRAQADLLGAREDQVRWRTIERDALVDILRFQFHAEVQFQSQGDGHGIAVVSLWPDPDIPGQRRPS